MADRVDQKARRRIMSANRSKDTGPEMEVRKALFGRGFRYRIHPSRLPGKPDIVLGKYRAAIFVHGCFWHGHDCRRRPESKTNRSFWEGKIARNRIRDHDSICSLLDQGWRVLVIWECAIRRKSPPFEESEDLESVIDWIKGIDKLATLSERGFDRQFGDVNTEWQVGALL